MSTAKTMKTVLPIHKNVSLNRQGTIFMKFVNRIEFQLTDVKVL